MAAEALIAFAATKGATLIGEFLQKELTKGKGESMMEYKLNSYQGHVGHSGMTKTKFATTEDALWAHLANTLGAGGKKVGVLLIRNINDECMKAISDKFHSNGQEINIVEILEVCVKNDLDVQRGSFRSHFDGVMYDVRFTVAPVKPKAPESKHHHHKKNRHKESKHHHHHHH